MGEILVRGVVPHRCNPPLETYTIILPASISASRKDEPYQMEREPPPGTVWRCECGKLWEVLPNPYRNVMKRGDWRPAGLITRLKYRAMTWG